MKNQSQTEIVDLVNKLIEDINSTFKDLVACEFIYKRGYSQLEKINDRTLITQKIGKDIELEPLLAIEVSRFREKYPNFLYDVFQGKFIQIWINFLHDVFELLLDLHFGGKRKFKELGGEFAINFDFSSEKSVSKEIKDRILHEFEWAKYQKNRR